MTDHRCTTCDGSGKIKYYQVSPNYPETNHTGYRICTYCGGSGLRTIQEQMERQFREEYQQEMEEKYRWD
jgi:DnaJ-class molecular chaperone